MKVFVYCITMQCIIVAQKTTEKKTKRNELVTIYNLVLMKELVLGRELVFSVISFTAV